MKCPKCQTELESDAAFCTSCGSKIEPSQKQEFEHIRVLGSEEAKKPERQVDSKSGGGKGCLALSLVFLVLFLVGASVLSYFAYKYYKQSTAGAVTGVTTPLEVESTPLPVESTPPAVQTPSKPLLPPKTTAPVSGRTLKDFSGSWTLQETGKPLVFKEQDGQVVAHPSDAGEIRLGFLGEPGQTVHGTYSEGAESYTASAEISQDGKSLTLTLAPPASEYIVVKLQRGESVKPPLSTEGVEGIEALKLDNPDTYLPLINSRYKLYRRYADGDEGAVEILVGALDGGRVAVERAESKFFPGDEILDVYRYEIRSNGVYKIPDANPQNGGIWLPAGLKKGKLWKSEGGTYQVVEFDKNLSLGKTSFSGALVVREQLTQVGVDRKVTYAPGYGVIRMVDTNGGYEWLVFRGVGNADADTVSKALRKARSVK